MAPKWITDRVFDQRPLLRRYARALRRDGGLAEDLVHDTLVRAYEKRHTFRRGADFRAWLLTIVHNLFVSQWRREKSAREGASRLRDMLSNWEHYIHDAEDVDPLIRMAVMHYQFEAIHPFTDGNGRTGRVLNLLFLIEKGLLAIPVLYLSQYIIRHKPDYYRLLLGVTVAAAWEPWLLFMMDAVRETARWTTEKIKAIRALLEGTADKIRLEAPKTYSRELAELIFVQPYCRIGNLVDAGIARRQSASVYLKKLCEIGILEERKAGREKLFVNPAFLQLLTTADGQ